MYDINLHQSMRVLHLTANATFFRLAMNKIKTVQLTAEPDV